MSDESSRSDPRVIWKEQPREDTPVIVDHVINRRSQQLHMSTRSEIIMSIVAALFFVAVLAWRLPPVGFALQPVGLAAAALWIAITVFRFRQIIWALPRSPTPPQPDLSTTAANSKSAATISATFRCGTDRCCLPRCFSSRASPAARSRA